ncbi:MAG: hypothetical protein V4709_15890 [Pseudomonadota bacterium]
MEMILNYLSENKLFGIFLVLGITYLISRLVVPASTKVRPEDTVPGYKRFERRESERGNRRQPHALPFTGIERRHDLRRIDAG